MNYTYDNFVKPYSSNFHLIEIEQDKIKLIDEFIKNIREVKKKENHHQIDSNAFYQRFFTGTLGELALEKFFKIDGIVNWEVGESNSFHKSDLRSLNLNIGIKTVKYGQFPIIFKKSYNDEIIMIRWKNRFVYICGLARKDILNKYQSDELIIDPKLKSRGTKTGFYGFEHLLHFNDLNHLKELVNQ